MLSIGTPTTAFMINFATAVAILALGFFVLNRSAKSRVHQLLALQAISLSLWIFSSSLSDIALNEETALFFANMAIIGPFFFAMTLYFFSHYFPYERFQLKYWQSLAIAAPVVIAWPFFFSSHNIESVDIQSWGTDFVPGNLYTLLGVYLLAMMFLSAWEVIVKLRRIREKEARLQLLYFMSGFVFTIVFGSIANLVLPLLGFAQASTIGPAATIFFVLFTSYAIIKHHLLNVKIIAAEMFSGVVVLLVFFQIFGSDSPQTYAIRITTFVLTAFFAILLVRSVIREVEQRQEVQRLAKELQSRNVQLKKLGDLKTTMVSIASHQLRGPLGGMRGYLTMFRDGDLGPLTDKQKDIVKMNLSTLSRLLNAVETFLDITRIEAGKMVLRKEVLPLDQAVHEVAHEFEVMLRKKGLELKTDIEEHVWVNFDPEKIKHVIFNLVDNAMKYTDAGFISVTLHKEGGEAVFQVMDSGKGIPPEDIKRLFGKFERGGLAVDRGGSGLGLYIVKMLTEMQDGSVDVTSPGVGKGSTFHVRLPLAPTPH